MLNGTYSPKQKQDVGSSDDAVESDMSEVVEFFANVDYDKQTKSGDAADSDEFWLIGNVQVAKQFFWIEGLLIRQVHANLLIDFF